MSQGPMFTFVDMAFQSTMLAIESQQVIAMRLTKFARGGSDVSREAELMISEKIISMFETSQMMIMAAVGGKQDLDAGLIVAHYRQKVSANIERLRR